MFDVIFVFKLSKKSKSVIVLEKLLISTDCVYKLTAFIHYANSYRLIVNLAEILICNIKRRDESERKYFL